MTEANKKTTKIALISLIILVSLLILTVLIYVIYVFSAYYRIEDNLVLEINSKKTEKLQLNHEYSALTYNIGFGAYSQNYSFFMDGGEYSRAFSKDDVVKNTYGAQFEVERYNPDFILLQEVDTSSTRNYKVNQLEIFDKAFEDYNSIYAENYNSPYLFYPIFSPHGKSHSGIATYSKYQIESAVRQSLPIESGLSKLVDLDRCYSVSKIPCENGKYLCLYNIHLSAYTSDGSIATEQLQVLVEEIIKENAQGNYIVVGGDFNKDLLGNSDQVFGVEKDESAYWAQAIPEGIIPNQFTLVANDNSPTCRNANIPYTPGQSFVITVDGFIVSNNISIRTSFTCDNQFMYSDHQPVIIYFKLI